ncbi:class I SAM-dependent RNA methyltransferase [Cyanobium sp. FGCU-6]|nr:class I SAM-dependent RNA methyltransferase [Cyanobium sp. FGCU6]
MQRSATTSTHFPVTAVVPPGLEEPAAAELVHLGAAEVRPLRRAVACITDLAGLYRLHLQARLPFRFLRELARFPCRDPRELRRGVQAAAPWELWLPPERSLRVEASGSLPELNHSHYTALEVKNALVDLQRQRWGERSTVDLRDPDLRLHLHLSPSAGGLAILSLESGGGSSAGGESGPAGGGGGDGRRSDGSLHRRGYRAAMGLAPLKENLAAGLIAHTGWEGSVPLVDPLCGSGTLLLEAAAMALGQAAGLIWGDGGVGPAGSGPDAPAVAPRPRPFGLMRWPDFDAALWSQAVAEARSSRRSTLADGDVLAPILGLERDPRVLRQARANAAAAGLADHLQFQQGDFRDLIPPPGPGMLVCNPPYGVRLGAGEDLEALYADLGRMLRERCSGWTLWLLSGNPELTGALRMKASRRIPVSNGGIDCRWLRYDIR